MRPALLAPRWTVVLFLARPDRSRLPIHRGLRAGRRLHSRGKLPVCRWHRAEARSQIGEWGAWHGTSYPKR